MNLNVKVVSDLEEAKRVWEILSPKSAIDEQWEFRYAFFKPLNYNLHFICLYESDSLVALLPLQKNNLNGLMPPYYEKNGKEFYEFFGGDDTDDNKVFVKDGLWAGSVYEIFKSLPQNTYLAPLEKEIIMGQKAQFYTNKFVMDISKFKNYDEYIDAYFFQKSRGKFKRDIRNIFKDQNIEVTNNNLEDLDLMFDLNIKSHPDSSFKFDYRKEIFRELMSLYQVELISVEVNGEKKGVSYGIVHNNIYYSMNVGVDHSVNNLGKLLVLLQMQRAIDLDCHTYDAGKGESGWKEHFKFQKIPQYIFVKK